MNRRQLRRSFAQAWRAANFHRPHPALGPPGFTPRAPSHCRLCASHWRVSIRWREVALHFAEQVGVLS